jgi:SAM-dependent methyltransferase
MGLLRCPVCDTAPQVHSPRCPGCGRPIGARNGGLDLLSDQQRAAAEGFANQYTALRKLEGWADASGSESPDGTKRWRDRRAAIARAVSFLEHGLAGDHHAVVGDIGAGGGWAAHLLPGADVIAFDLLDLPGGDGPALRVRGDMRCLPLGAGTIDAVLYSAALHHAPIQDVTQEAARVLRRDGLLVAAESPIYPNPQSRGEAARRSAAYYSRVGCQDLGARYFPIEVGELREALNRSGFHVERLESPRRRYSPAALVLGRRFPVLVARLTT